MHIQRNYTVFSIYSLTFDNIFIPIASPVTALNLKYTNGPHTLTLILLSLANLKRHHKYYNFPWHKIKHLKNYNFINFYFKIFICLSNLQE